MTLPRSAAPSPVSTEESLKLVKMFAALREPPGAARLSAKLDALLLFLAAPGSSHPEGIELFNMLSWGCATNKSPTYPSHPVRGRP